MHFLHHSTQTSQYTVCIGHRLRSIKAVQLLSCVRLFVTPWTTARQASLSITNSKSLPKLMSIESAMPSNHLILCHPLLLLPSNFPSIRVFSSESALHIRCPNCWYFSFSISPSNEDPGRISFRMDWLDLLAVQGTLKRLLQHHSSKASILQCSAFSVVQLSHPHMTTGKTIALIRHMPAHKSALICVCVTRMGPLPARAPFRVFTLSNWSLPCHSSTSLCKDPRNPHRCWAHSCVPELQKPHCQGSPCCCEIYLPMSANSAQVNGWYVMNSVTSGGPGALWGWPPCILSCSCFTFAIQ